nr:unnamed protein product [Callosobruchus analis]
MVVDKSPLGGNLHALEQFVLLAKSARGAGCTELIKQALEAPGVYVFGELLDMPNILELAESPVDKKYLDALELFAFGTYKDYLANKGVLPELTPAQRKKLQHLTIVTLATKSKRIPYNTLLVELDISNVRDLEDLIIEAIYADIVRGKLDQKNSQLEVDYAIGRDIRPKDIDVIVNCLQDWCSACEGVLGCVESQIQRANSARNKAVQRRSDVEQEIVNIKKALKAQMQERADGGGGGAGGPEEAASVAGGGPAAEGTAQRDATPADKKKATQKIKGLKILR